MSHKKLTAILMILFVLTAGVSYAAKGKGKIGSMAQLDSDSIVLQYDRPIKKVHVVFKAGDDGENLDVLLFIQALRARLSQKGFDIVKKSEEADVFLSLIIKKIDKTYWFGLPGKFGTQRRVECLSVDTTYETTRGRWNKELMGHKGYWTYKGDGYYRNTMTNDLARAIVNPFHDYTKEKDLIEEAGKGNIEAVLGFVHAGLNINAENDLGFTPLIAASKGGHSQIVRLFISLDVNVEVDAKDNEGWTALSYAAYNDDVEIAALLLDNGAFVDAGNYEGFTALDLAVLEGRTSIVTLLIFHNAAIGNALKLAKKKGNKELERVLSDYARRTNQSVGYGCGYLLGLIRNESNERIKHVMEQGLVVLDREDNGCKDALITAARKGNIEVIDFFLDRGFGVDMENNSGEALLPEAAAEGHQGLVKMLISKGVDMFRFGSSALASAAGSGEQGIVEYLLSENVNINTRGKSGATAGETPLGEAARAGRKDMVELLLSQGAKINSENKDGRTALMAAALAGKAEVVGLLLLSGADIDQGDKDGHTVLDLMSKARRRQEIDGVDYRNVVNVLERNKLENLDKRKKLRSIAR